MKRESTTLRDMRLPGLIQRAGCIAACLLLLSGCVVRSTVPSYEPAVPPPAFQSSQQPGDYKLGAGDGVRIRFPYHEELNTQGKIAADGLLTVPGLGAFFASGRSTNELEADIYERASLTHRDPVVAVSVAERAERRVYVGGRVRRPGYVVLSPGMTTLRAITERGGFTYKSEPTKVVLIRWDDTGAYSATRLDIEEVLETGNTHQDLALLDNDVIYVPPSGAAVAADNVELFIRDMLPIREPTTRLDVFE